MSKRNLCEVSDSDDDDEVLMVDSSVKKPKLVSSCVHDEFLGIKVKKKGSQNETEGRKCKICSQTFINKNPTNLKNHLRSKHPETYTKVMKKDGEAKIASSEAKVLVPSNSNCQTPAAEALFKKYKDTNQNKISDIFLPSLKGLKTSSQTPRPKMKEETSEKLLGLWIGGSTLPISCVEDDNMLLWLKSYDSQAVLPSRFKLRKLVNNTADQLVALIKESTGLARKVYITLDIWTSQCSTDSFLGVTAHMYNPKTGKRETYRICCREFKGSHTGISIANKLKSVLQEYGIFHKVSKMLTDCASNMIKAGRDINELNIDSDDEEDFPCSEDESDCDSISEEDEENFDDRAPLVNAQPVSFETGMATVRLERLNCIAHRVNTVVENTLNDRSSVFGRVLKKTRKFVIKYRRSAKAKGVLMKYYKRRLAGFCKTRWWTDVFMVKSVLLASEADGAPLEKLADEMEWNISITDRDVADLKLFIGVMSPFEQLFSKLNGELYSTINQVFPSLMELKSLLEKKVNEEKIGKFCKVLLTQVNNTFGFVCDPRDENFEPIYITTTFLDPYYKFLIDDGLKDMVFEYLLTLVKKNSGNDDNIEENADENPEESVSFVISGLSNISESISTRSVPPTISSSGASSLRACLQMDLTLYERKSNAFLAKVYEQAKQKASSTESNEDTVAKKVEVKPRDPLDFWTKQVTHFQSH